MEHFFIFVVTITNVALLTAYVERRNYVRQLEAKLTRVPWNKGKAGTYKIKREK